MKREELGLGSKAWRTSTDFDRLQAISKDYRTTLESKEDEHRQSTVSYCDPQTSKTTTNLKQCRCKPTHLR